MSSTSAETTEWETFASIAARFNAYLTPLCKPCLQDEGRSYGCPPHLALEDHMVDITNELQGYALSQEHLQSCVLVYEQSLRDTSTEFQESFETKWLQIKGDKEFRDRTQRTLSKLYQDRFVREISVRRDQVIDLIRRESSQKVASLPDIDGAGEWTEDTRALMERVYQQHPKLEGHEKKLLAEVSGLSLRQVSIWFANQRQRKGWPLQQEESVIEEEGPEEIPSTLIQSSRLASSTSSSAERCPSPLTPASINSACPSLSSSTSSRSSSDSWDNAPSHAAFQFGAQLPASQAPTFAFTQSTPHFDIDQLLRQLTPQANTPEAIYNSINPSSATINRSPPNEAAKGPFAFLSEDSDMTTSNGTTPPSTMDSFQWLPINMQGLLPQADITLSNNHSIEDMTPQANQLAFAPLQLDTSQYLRQSPSANVDLSSVIGSFNANDFWNSFANANNIPSMPSLDFSLAPTKKQRGNDGVAIAQENTDWSDVFFKDIDTWGKPPQLAQPQLQF